MSISSNITENFVEAESQPFISIYQITKVGYKICLIFIPKNSIRRNKGIPEIFATYQGLYFANRDQAVVNLAENLANSTIVRPIKDTFGSEFDTYEYFGHWCTPG